MTVSPMATIRPAAAAEELACSVHSDPGLPEPIAVSMGMSSSPRTSPTRMRRAFIRRACVINTARLISPAPSALASACFEGDDALVAMRKPVQAEFGFLLQHDDFFEWVEFGGERAKQRGFAGVQPAGHDDVLAGADCRGEETGEGGVDGRRAAGGR